MTEEAINVLIQGEGVNTNNISDGYHTFGELYEHRIVLWIQLAKAVDKLNESYSINGDSVGIDIVWRSKAHSNGSIWDGWFILGIGKEKGGQMTYHLPNHFWDECDFAIIIDRAPDYDEHTSSDVLERLKKLIKN